MRQVRTCIILTLDPCDFGTVPDPRIRNSDLRIRIRIFSSVAVKMLTKNSCFFHVFCSLLFEDFLTITSRKIAEIKGFSLFLLVTHQELVRTLRRAYGSGTDAFTEQHTGQEQMRTLSIRISFLLI
jgi:hypothetical protein